MDRIRKYIDDLFMEIEDNEDTRSTKDEMYCDMMEKYRDLIESGRSEEEAYGDVIDSLGDMDELLESFPKKTMENSEYFNGTENQCEIQKEYTFRESYSRVNIEGDIFSFRISGTKGGETLITIDSQDRLLEDCTVIISLIDDTLNIVLKRTVPGGLFGNFGFNSFKGNLVDVRIPEKFMEEIQRFDAVSVSGSLDISRIRATKVKVSSVSGSISADTVVGEKLSIKTVSGRIRIENCGGKKASFSSVSGSIEGHGVAGEDIKIESVSGSKKFHSVKGESIEIDSVSGSTFLEDFTTDKLICRSTSGSIKVYGTVERYGEFENLSGSTRGNISCKEGEFQILKGQSMSGSIAFEVPDHLLVGMEVEKGFMNRRLTSGKGGEVTLRSTTGSLNLEESLI